MKTRNGVISRTSGGKNLGIKVVHLLPVKVQVEQERWGNSAVMLSRTG